jgi:hypothetical protein
VKGSNVRLSAQDTAMLCLDNWLVALFKSAM